MRPLAVFFCLIVLLGGAALAFLHFAPARYDPFAPLAIDEDPTFLTAWKLRGLKGDPEACFALLDAAGIDYRAIPDRVTGPGCGFQDAARLRHSSLRWGPSGVPLTCPMIAALAVWERHDLQPAARDLLGAEVAEIDHFGSYACRNVNNAVSGRRSQHARANALDVAGFRLSDGRRVSVLRDWDATGAEGVFLKRIQQGACARFASVLGPDHNAAHANHFHFDMGGFGLCR
ncbi:MAG: extensin family protein [Kiloniellaceae bacterium]